MMRIVGLDPSLTNTGVALLEDGKCVDVHTVKTCRGSIPARYLWIEQEVGQVLRKFKPHVIGCERYLTGKESSEDLYALQVILQLVMVRLRCRVAFLLPNQWRSVFYDRRGLAEFGKVSPSLDADLDMLEAKLDDKQAVIRRMKAETGFSKVNSHEAEAYYIALVAGRFFAYVDGDLVRKDLTDSERYVFDRPESSRTVFDQDDDPMPMTGLVHRKNLAWFDFRTEEDLLWVMGTLEKKKGR